MAGVIEARNRRAGPGESPQETNSTVSLPLVPSLSTIEDKIWSATGKIPQPKNPEPKTNGTQSAAYGMAGIVEAASQRATRQEQENSIFEGQGQAFDFQMLLDSNLAFQHEHYQLFTASSTDIPQAIHIEKSVSEDKESWLRYMPPLSQQRTRLGFPCRAPSEAQKKRFLLNEMPPLPAVFCLNGKNVKFNMEDEIGGEMEDEFKGIEGVDLGFDYLVRCKNGCGCFAGDQGETKVERPRLLRDRVFWWVLAGAALAAVWMAGCLKISIGDVEIGEGQNERYDAVASILVEVNTRIRRGLAARIKSKRRTGNGFLP